MTKRDFETIARALKPWVTQGEPDREDAKAAAIAKDIADALGSRARQFDRRRFLAACGVEA